MFEHVAPAMWMLVPADVRRQIVRDFHINRTGASEIRDQQVISDGYTKDDLSVLNAESMAAYVGSEESFPRLWELTCAKAYSIINPPMGEIKLKQEEKQEVTGDSITSHEQKPKTAKRK